MAVFNETIPAVMDVIVISSSPEHQSAVPPTPQPDEPERISRRPQCDISPILSPSELVRPPSRSRFFDSTTTRSDKPPPSSKQKSTKDVTTKDAPMAAQPTDLVQDKPSRRGRKPKNAPATSESKENASVKPSGMRKRQTKGGKEPQKLTNKNITGRVVKSGHAESRDLDAKKTSGLPSSTPSPSRITSRVENLDWEKDGLQLDLAMKRRLDWTPSKDTATKAIGLDETIREASQPRLGTLLSEYGYNEVQTASKESQVFGESGPTKRRRIELVDARVCPSKPVPLGAGDKQMDDSCPSGSGSPTVGKPKKRPKKLKTITARVTAPYENSPTETSGSGREQMVATVENLEAGGRRSRKTKRNGTSCLEFRGPRFAVLSPEAAVNSLNDQDLVFGTCSQLERDDPPNLLRETQIAMQESEKEALSAPQSRLNRDTKSTFLPSRTVSRFTNPGGLWSFAARDTDGSLAEAEVLDLIDTSDAFKTTGSRTNCSNGKENEDRVNKDKKKTSHLPTLELLKARADPSAESELPVLSTQAGRLVLDKPIAKPNPPMPHYDGFTDVELTKKVQDYGFKAIKNRKKVIEVLKKCWESKHGPSNQEGGEAPPTSLAAGKSGKSASKTAPRKPREPKAPQKKKSEVQLQTNSSNATTLCDITTEMVSKNGGRSSREPSPGIHQQNHDFIQEESPQVTSTRYFIDVEEIQDSEEELIPSPSRLHSRYLPYSNEERQPLLVSAPLTPSPSRTTTYPSRSGLAIALGTATTTKAATEAATGKPSNLGELITKAVRAQPRLAANGAQLRPSWHEKIIVYDPIVLEDFTAWLNTEGLNLVNEDREVDAGFVREWCESKGICCCCKLRKTLGHY